MRVPKVKGSAIVSAVKMLRSTGSVARQALPPSLHGYLDDRVLVSSWYPETEAMQLYRALATAVPSLGRDPLHAMGRIAAHEHANETYKHLVAARDATGILRHAGTIWRAQHDDGEMEPRLEGPGAASIELSGHTNLSEDWCRLLAGYVVGMVEVGGGKDIACEVPVKDFVTKRAVFRVTWS